MLSKLWNFLTGYVLMGVRVQSIERHVEVMNTEMGRLDARQDKQGEDIAYIRGRVDK